MKTLPILKKGSKIRIVSPAGKIERKYMQPAVEWLQNQGYKVELGKHVFNQHFQFSGTPEQRLIDLQVALDDHETSTIICSRGGYGAIQIIEQLDFTGFKKHPKWVVGFSDITVLHACLNNMGFASIHGVMPRYFMDEKGNPSENLLTLLDLLVGTKLTYIMEPSPLNRNGEVSSELVGGNMSIIGSLLGTKFDLDINGKILFLEDVNEYLYKIDRLMYQLKLSGKLKSLRGLVIGDFSDIKDNNTPFGKSVQEIIFDAVKEYDYPVCFNFHAGHNAKNMAVALGSEYLLSVSEMNSKLIKQ